MYSRTRRHCTLLSLLALTSAGCAPDAAPQPPQAASTHDQPAEPSSPEPVFAGPVDVVDHAQRVATKPLETYFSGRALEAIQRDSQPAPQTVVDEVAARASAVASTESCRNQGAPEAARLIDLDADGILEVLSFYELSGCGDNTVIRVLSVLRDDGQGGWTPAVDAALSVLPGDRRPILEIRDGAIVVAGGPDGMGGMADSEVIPVPGA